MNCYVCGFPRPEGANYCPGCGRYCADDPNVSKNISIPEGAILTVEIAPTEPCDAAGEATSVEETVSEEDTLLNAEEQPEQLRSPMQEDISALFSEPAQPVNPPPKRQKKHHPVLIPVLIMAALFVMGIAAWWAMPYASGFPDTPTEATQPGNKKPPLPSDKRNNKSDASKETYPATDERCFRIKDGVVRFMPDRYDGNPILVIPSEIDGQIVTGIADSSFAGLEDVTTLILPDTLESIGKYAFENCPKLRGVYIPDSVTSIGESAFAGCIDLESVSIPMAIETIGKHAFDGCASLMYIFYEGTFEEWEALYSEYITPFTYAICADGEYYHGALTP